MQAHEEVCGNGDPLPPSSAPVYRRKKQIATLERLITEDFRHQDDPPITAVAAEAGLGLEFNESPKLQTSPRRSITKSTVNRLDKLSLTPIPPENPKISPSLGINNATHNKHNSDKKRNSSKQIEEDHSVQELQTSKPHSKIEEHYRSYSSDQDYRNDDGEAYEDQADIPEKLDLTGQLQPCPVCDRKFLSDRLV